MSVAKSVLHTILSSGAFSVESVTQLQLALARPTWEMLIEDRTIAFHDRLNSYNAESPVHVIS